jgi:hypothetical protein
MSRIPSRTSILILALFLAACGQAVVPAGQAYSLAPVPDSGDPSDPDSGQVSDAGDAGPDAGGAADAGDPDSGPQDAGSDAGQVLDAGDPDAGPPPCGDQGEVCCGNGIVENDTYGAYCTGSSPYTTDGGISCEADVLPDAGMACTYCGGEGQEGCYDGSSGRFDLCPSAREAVTDSSNWEGTACVTFPGGCAAGTVGASGQACYVSSNPTDPTWPLCCPGLSCQDGIHGTSCQ